MKHFQATLALTLIAVLLWPMAARPHSVGVDHIDLTFSLTAVNTYQVSAVSTVDWFRVVYSLDTATGIQFSPQPPSAVSFLSSGGELVVGHGFATQRAGVDFDLATLSVTTPLKALGGQPYLLEPTTDPDQFDIVYGPGAQLFGPDPGLDSSRRPLPVFVAILGSAQLLGTKADLLIVDIDGDGEADPGDTIQYTIVVQNPGVEDARNAAFEDRPGANTTLVVGSVATSQGVVSRGNTAGDSDVRVEFGTVPPGGGTVTVTFNVMVDNPLPFEVTELTNQGSLVGDEVPQALTDDPDTAASSDPTVTLLDSPLNRCEEELNMCLATPGFEDADADGEEDRTDRCSDTPAESHVDTAGCSRAQFCAGINDRQSCNRADWENDEPRSTRPRDCRWRRGSQSCSPE